MWFSRRDIPFCMPDKSFLYVDGATNIAFFVAKFKDINVVPHEVSIESEYQKLLY